MTETAVIYWPNRGQTQPTLKLDKGLRDALADFARKLWPTGTAKAAARAWDLTADEGKRLVKGRASQTTIEKILKNGGWPVVFPIMAEVIGQTAEQYIIEARKANEENGERLTSLVGNWGTVAPDRSVASPDLADAPGEQRRSFTRRVG